MYGYRAIVIYWRLLLWRKRIVYYEAHALTLSHSVDKVIYADKRCVKFQLLNLKVLN